MDTNLGEIVLVKDINPGIKDNYGSFPKDSFIGNLIEFNNKLYFTASDEENGNELWVSDGTTEGTQLLIDIDPSTDNYGNANSSAPESLTEFNGKLYFSADDGETGRELWVSDGTAEGTELLLDIVPGISEYGYAYSSDIRYFTELNGKLYFRADDGKTGDELWVTDGTTRRYET